MTTDWRTTRAGKEWRKRHGDRARVRTTWLTRARVLSGWTQREIAKELGLSARTWPTWEYLGRKRSSPSIDAARIITQQHWEGGKLSLDQIYDSPYVWVNPATLEVLR